MMMFEWYGGHDFVHLYYKFCCDRACRTQNGDPGNLMEGSEGKEQERILIPVANPETIEGLVGMALMMRHPKQKSHWWH